MAHSVTQNVWATRKEESQEMMAMWPDVVREITDMTKELNIPDITRWLEKVLEYNVPVGKKTRALALIYVYKSLAPGDQLTEDNIRLVRILAWCVELMQTYLLMIDDVQDRSLFRRGKPCWYRYNDIDLMAINDSLMLEGAIYYLIRKHFNGKECYTDLVETFQNTTFRTFMGQCLDLHFINFDKKPNLDLFTMDRYTTLAEIKTTIYTFILPVTAAIHLAGIKDTEIFKQAKNILVEMGHLLQVQDDYLACYGDPEVCGKDGTDIEEGKCTWLVVVALEHATPEQRKVLQECYGSSDPEKVRRVKQLFADRGLMDMYFTYEEKTYNLINLHIQQVSSGLLRNILQGLFEIYYRRVHIKKTN